MIVRDYRVLYDKLDEAKKLVKASRDDEEGIALANYIGNLYASMICMGNTVDTIDFMGTFRTKRNHRKFERKLNVYNHQLLRNFVLNKEFHHDYMCEVLPVVEDGLDGLLELPSATVEHISEKDFFDIFYSFLSDYHLLEEFNKLYKDNHIFSTQIGNGAGNLGSTLYNPVNGDIDLFLTDFNYSFPCMNTLAHEFGHGIDLKRFNGSIAEYNNYFYLSLYGEVLSRLMERLLHRYCLENGVMVEQVRDSYVNFEDLNHDFLLETYILSLLDRDFIYNEGFKDCDSSVIVRKVKKHFQNIDALKEYIDGTIDFDISDSLNYAYGDIISLLLLDEVQKNGFSSELLEYFLEKRESMFSEEFLRECGFGPGNYTKLYKKEVELIKK